MMKDWLDEIWVRALAGDTSVVLPGGGTRHLSPARARELANRLTALADEAESRGRTT